MKKRDVFLPSITTILITSMMMFLSCASQNRVKDELDVQAEATDEAQQEQVAEQEASEQVDQAVAEGGETTIDEQAQQSGELSELTQEGATTTEGAENQNADLAALEDIKAESGEAPTEAPVEGAAGAVTDLTTQAATETPAEPVLDPEAGSAATSPEVAVAPEPEVAPEVPVVPTFEDAKPARRARSFSGRSRVPTIPSNAVSRKGEKLNRFYFVRRGDTPKSLSQLFYGNEDHAKHLKKWNGGWKAGQIVYYKSPSDPNDTQMHSFYQERNVTPEEYTVGRGDWLSTVAKKKLGSSDSWKEIAVINGMSKPDALEVGQKLAMYPQDLSGFGGGTPVAQNEAPVPTQQQPIQPKAEPVQQEPAQAPSIQEPQEPVAEAPAPKKSLEPEAIDGSKFIEQNALAIVILGAAAVLLLALMMRRKKTTKLGDDFNEDNFAPPTKLKRK